MLALVAELNTRRIAMVCGALAKRQGGNLILPRRVLELLTTARRLHHRYMAGHYHHEDNEADRIRDLCQWLVIEHRQLQGRAPTTAEPFSWDATALTTKAEVPVDTYRELIVGVHDGTIDSLIHSEDSEP